MPIFWIAGMGKDPGAYASVPGPNRCDPRTIPRPGPNRVGPGRSADA
jgi:hypothetical protein